MVLERRSRLASTTSSSQTIVVGSLMQHPLPLRPCPELLQPVDGATPIILDSGVRTGLDIARAIMLGADFVLLRPRLPLRSSRGGDVILALGPRSPCVPARSAALG